MGVAAMPASLRSSSYACCLRRAGVVTEMPPAPPRTVPAMPSGFAGALIRDGGALPAHDLLLGGAPSAARNEAPQPMSGTGALGSVCYSLQQAPERERESHRYLCLSSLSLSVTLP